MDQSSPPRLEAQIAGYAHRGSSSSLFRPFEFAAARGHITCILGASGTGKTTLLRVLLGESTGIAAGQVRYRINGEALAPRAATAAGMVGALFQGDSLIPWKRVAGNLALPHLLNRRLAAPEEDAIVHSLRALSLDRAVLAQYPHQLSLGMRQRVQYARLLLYLPRFLLLDEPFLGLDPLNTDRIATSLRDYVTTHNACCVMVTHDLAIARRTADVFFYLSRSGVLTRLPDSAREEELRAAFNEDSL